MSPDICLMSSRGQNFSLLKNTAPETNITKYPKLRLSLAVFLAVLQAGVGTVDMGLEGGGQGICVPLQALFYLVLYL